MFGLKRVLRKEKLRITEMEKCLTKVGFWWSFDFSFDIYLIEKMDLMHCKILQVDLFMKLKILDIRLFSIVSVPLNFGFLYF